jgi:transcriptional regulator with XRE-family HTH domain
MAKRKSLTVGEMVEAAIVSRRFTQAALAGAARTSQSSISKIKRGLIKEGASSARRVRQVLEASAGGRDGLVEAATALEAVDARKLKLIIQIIQSLSSLMKS